MPLQQLIQQIRYHIVGTFPQYEEQLTSYTAEDLKTKSPDRMDSGVHGVRELLGLNTGKAHKTGSQVRNARLAPT